MVESLTLKCKYKYTDKRQQSEGYIREGGGRGEGRGTIEYSAVLVLYTFDCNHTIPYI